MVYIYPKWEISPSFNRVYSWFASDKMVVSTYFNGNLAYYYNENWYYSDDNSMVNPDDIKPCTKCGKMPTPEGYDACLGYIPNAKYACCGHGKTAKYIIYKENK